MVSPRANRSSATALGGASVGGKVAIFLGPSVPITNVLTVALLLDGQLRWIDFAAPYDLLGGTASSANLLNTAALTRGAHTVTAVVILLGGGVFTYRDAFSTA